jgi:hypothetical protein
MTMDDFVEYDFTTGEPVERGSHLRPAIMVEPTQPWWAALLDRLGPNVLWLTSAVSVAMWAVVAVCAWLGMSAAGWLEVPQ